MPRPSVIIEKAGLEEQIKQAEAANTFVNQSRLFEFLCSSPWAATIKDSLGKPFQVKPVNIYQKVIQYNIPMKTPKGKKGGVKTVGAGVVRGKKDRSANRLPLLQSTPEEFKPLAAKVSGGSMKAAIRLKCLECCCWQRKEANECQIKTCALWSFLPRKNPKNLEENT